MQASDWLQLGLFLAALAALTKPIGAYLSQVLDPRGRTWIDPVVAPLERFTYRVMGVEPGQEQDWQGYTRALLLFSLGGCLFTYALLRLQHLLPLNPQGFGPLSPDLAFNTAVSFVTNTNWQSYGGESTMSYFSQMVALTLHHFTSAATGIGVAAALVRGLARSASSTVGNFWTDLVRITYRLLLPASLGFALFLVSQGVIQNFQTYLQVPGVASGMPSAPSTDDPGRNETSASPAPRTAEEATTARGQVIAQGPAASQTAIKMLGTNGGGFMNANAAHPFENPNPLSNFVQMLSIFVLGSGLTWHLGRATGSQGHGWAVWGVMTVLFVAGAVTCVWAEANGNPIHHALGIAVEDGNMEGKEVRFGIFGSALFATITTDASCGAVNAMHDSFTALGGLVQLFNMQLGEIVFGGVGSGLYGMLIFVVLAVFLAGLMVGRTPEYLGKKIVAADVKLTLLALLILCLPVLGFSAWALASDWGLAGLNNRGPHGLSEILYAYTSATGNNGSAFAGLGANTPPYNLTLGLAMLAGRFLVIIPVLGLAGSFARKKASPPGPGMFPVTGGTFMILLLGTVLLVGALNFLPALALGPIVEHFLTAPGQLF